MYFISQLGEHDCAFACLKMMLAYHHHDKNYLYLPLPENIDEKGMSFQEMILYARAYNLELNGVKINDPKELFRCKEFPIVVTLKVKKDRHAVVLLKANSKRVVYFDPNIGKKKVPTEFFLKEWTGKALILSSVVKTKCPVSFPDFISKKDKIILPILQTMSGVGLLLGTFFISGEYTLILPIVFFGLFIIFEILFRSSLIGAMKRMDDNIFEYGFKNEKKDYYSLFSTIEKYRHISLTLTPNYIFSWLVTIFLAVILVINDPVNLVYIILPLALGVINVFLYQPYFALESTEIVEKEKEICDVQDDFQFKMKSSEIHSLAYRLGLNKNVYTYLEIASLLITIILTMTVTKSINITYVIFYLCISLFLKNNFEKILQFSSTSEEFDLVRLKLLNSLADKDNNS